jgi:hypothetical protein
MKNIQINFDENTITLIEKIAALSKKTRAAVIREAVTDWLKQKRINDFESKWIKALEQEKADYTNTADSDDTDAWLAAEEWNKS